MKMLVHNAFQIILVLFDVVNLSVATTHWVLTENGRIQSQVDSVFRLNRPYDLIEFLKQEERAQNVVKLYEDMVRKKIVLDNQWATLSSATELEKNLFSDDDCTAAREELLDFDSDTIFYEYASEDFNDVEGDLISEEGSTDLDCSRFFQLDFSMATFPHLQVLREPWNLTWPDESDISIPLSSNQIYYSLNKNSTSWYHYNLASLYWRQKGAAQKALDCIKRSLHFAPRHFKDVPMLNLGVMLQRAQCTAEAAILLHSVIDHAPLKPKGHFLLANVYTSLGNYNRSIAYYDNALSLKPNWGIAKRARHAIICHYKVKNTLNNLQNSIQNIIDQFQEFNSIQEKLVKNQEDILKQQQTPLTSTFSTLLPQSGECLSSSATDDQLVCDISNENPSSRHIHVDAMSLQLLLSKVESQAQKISDYVPLPNFEDNNFRNAFSKENKVSYETLNDGDINSNNKNDLNDNKVLEKINFKDSTNFTKYQIK
ncbi:tetratricopeptide repeat protein 17 isoform X2 [Rhodnius prolixus]|uniref:tetratricopeptide repeat protein 17 isoform X2 n=1 Tax=Rhodnius prolixus TaxID=13249 RepID=UPI003D189F7E